jgi:S1-C subfamily serine protease
MRVFTLTLLLCALTAKASEPPVVQILGSTPGNLMEPRGLGFVVEKEGFVLTNYGSLVDGEDGQLLQKIEATLHGNTYPAEIIGVEPTIGIGILQLKSDESFEPVVAATDREIEVGMELEALAFDGREMKRIDGVVSGLNTKLCYQHSLASTMFRAEIDLPDASRGGPVFHADSGEVAAIHTGYQPEPEPGHEEDGDETHLLPINLCFNIYESLKTKRSLKSPWTGFSVRPLKAEEQRFFPTAKRHNGGVGIEDIWENSPAERLGIQPDDILVQLGYNRILSVADFQKWLYMYGVGHKVKLIILRNGTEYLMSDYVIEERPDWAKPK